MRTTRADFEKKRPLRLAPLIETRDEASHGEVLNEHGKGGIAANHLLGTVTHCACLDIPLSLPRRQSWANLMDPCKPDAARSGTDLQDLPDSLFAMSRHPIAIVTHRSAARLYLTCPFALGTPSRATPLRDAIAHAEIPQWLRFDHLDTVTNSMSAPLELLVPDKQLCRNSHHVKARCSKDNYPANAFRKLHDGIYIPSPELSYVQMAQLLSPARLAEYGTNLCARFYRDPVTHAIGQRQPLTSTRSIKRFIERSHGLHGIERARMTLKRIADNSASPMETKSFLLLSLPYRLGGYGITGLHMNHRIHPKRRSSLVEQSYFEVDLCMPDMRVGIEYHGVEEHQNVIHDRRRLDALGALGWHMVVIDKWRLYDAKAFEVAALQICQHLGRRLRRDESTWWSNTLALRSELGLR